MTDKQGFGFDIDDSAMTLPCFMRREGMIGCAPNRTIPRPRRSTKPYDGPTKQAACLGDAVGTAIVSQIPDAWSDGFVSPVADNGDGARQLMAGHVIARLPIISLLNMKSAASEILPKVRQRKQRALVSRLPGSSSGRSTALTAAIRGPWESAADAKANIIMLATENRG